MTEDQWALVGVAGVCVIMVAQWAYSYWPFRKKKDD